MLAVAVFLGFQLFCAGPKGAANLPTTKSSTEVLAEMRTFGAQGKPDSIRQWEPIYKQKIDEEFKKDGKSADAARDAKLTSSLILADAYLQKAQKETTVKGKVVQAEQAYHILHPIEQSRAKDAYWKSSVELSPRKEGEKAVVSTPKALYDETTKFLDANYKQDMVWGLVQGYTFIDTLVNLTGRNPNFSYAFAALLLAICVRAIIWPLAQKQLMWSRQMSQLQPLIKELEEAYKKKDPSGAYRSTPEYQQKVMGLYSEYGINPMKGCLPAFAQMPLFLFVYACMLHYRFSFREGTFLWINPATSEASNGFFAPSLGIPDTLLLIIYGASMIVTTFLAPVTDPSQLKQQRIIGISIAVLFTVIMFFAMPVPSAFVLYWIFTNIFSALQSWRAYKLPLPPLEKKNAPGGGVFPFNLGAAMNGQNNGNGTPTSNGAGIFGKSGGPKPQKPSKKK